MFIKGNKRAGKKKIEKYIKILKAYLSIESRQKFNIRKLRTSVLKFSTFSCFLLEGTNRGNLLTHFSQSLKPSHRFLII